MQTIQSTPLETFTTAALIAAGAPETHAATVAKDLIKANLLGHDSHGIVHLPRYLAKIDSGQLNPAAHPNLIKQKGSTAIIDAAWGFGFVAAHQAAQHATQLATTIGTGLVAIQRVSHVGRLGAYPEQIAEQGLIGIAISSGTGPGGGVVAPYGGSQRLLGTNPLAIAIPTGDNKNILIDLATAKTSGGKITIAQRRNETLPKGAIINAQGYPSQDPEDFFNGGAQLPFGEHKGYALNIAIELLANLLTNFPPPTSSQWKRPGNPTLIGAINIENFIPKSTFYNLIQEFANTLRNSPPAPGFSAVNLPGDRSQKTLKERQQNGIPISPDTLTELHNIAQRYALELPVIKETI